MIALLTSEFVISLKNLPIDQTLPSAAYDGSQSVKKKPIYMKVCIICVHIITLKCIAGKCYCWEILLNRESRNVGLNVYLLLWNR